MSTGKDCLQWGQSLDKPLAAAAADTDGSSDLHEYHANPGL